MSELNVENINNNESEVSSSIENQENSESSSIMNSSEVKEEVKTENNSVVELEQTEIGPINEEAKNEEVINSDIEDKIDITEEIIEEKQEDIAPLEEQTHDIAEEAPPIVDQAPENIVEEITSPDETVIAEEVKQEEQTQRAEEGVAKEKVETEEAKTETTETEETKEVAAEEVSEETQEVPSWYIIHTYSGHEFKVKERIEQRSQAMNMTHKITKVIVPEEESVEIKNNKRVERTNKMFPGYVFVEMVLDNETWFLIRKIPGVSKFLGPKSMPLPVTEKEMLRVLQQVGVKAKKIEVDFEVGELIKVVLGPFRGYQGGINEIFPDRGKLKAKISIFGRETPVELDFDQVEKVIK